MTHIEQPQNLCAVPLNQPRLDALVAYFGRSEAAALMIKAIDGLGGRMRELQGASDAPQASRLGHEIKGMASMYGLDAVAEAALAIERGATDGSLPELVTTLDRRMADATRQLGAFAHDLASPA